PDSSDFSVSGFVIPQGPGPEQERRIIAGIFGIVIAGCQKEKTLWRKEPKKQNRAKVCQGYKNRRVAKNFRLCQPPSKS
ncbi:MAG: hypothetical protein V1783_06820, partial [Bacteroidota bacterium]